MWSGPGVLLKPASSGRRNEHCPAEWARVHTVMIGLRGKVNRLLKGIVPLLDRPLEMGALRLPGK